MSEAPPDELPAEPPAPPVVTPALYLARCLVADKGMIAGHVAEAAPLAEACDYLLTGGDDRGLTMACIVDRDRDPAKRFGMSLEQLDEIAAACRHHADKLHGNRAAITIEIWEIGAGVPGAGDRARFEAYTFRQVPPKGAQVKAYAVNTAADALGDMISTASDGLQREPWVRKILKEPRRTPEMLQALAERRRTVRVVHRRPVATLSLLAAFAVMFVVSLVWVVRPNAGATTPAIETLIAFGGLDHGRVEDGEWWRMLTCAFLHGNVAHLLFNSLAMYMAGGLLENLVGRAWMLALFVIGAIGGSIASFTLNEPHVMTVGASGAIMALFGAAIVICFRLPSGPARNYILVYLGFVLVSSLVPIFEDGSAKVDYGAHLGGALVGAVAGGLLLLTWRRDADTPRAPRRAAGIAAVGLLVTAYGLGTAASDRDMYRAAFASSVKLDPALRELLAPYAMLRGPVSTTDLLLTHPRDPRVQYRAGLEAVERHDLPQAVEHFEKALAESELFVYFQDPASLELRIRLALSEAHLQLSDPDAARAVLLPVCDAGKRDSDVDVRTYVAKHCP